MAFLTKLAFIAGCLGLVSSAAVSTAQHHGHHVHHHGPLPAYDPATETTIEGTIDELLRLERLGCAGCEGGTHALLSGIEVEIHLCPASFLESLGCGIQEGDSLRVTGSKLTIGGSAVLLTRELQCGGKTVVLRDEDGRPLWSRRNR